MSGAKGKDICLSDSEDFETVGALEAKVAYDKICIFWDVGACPFPEGMDPDMIHQKIESALNERGAEGEMLIWAYADEKEDSWLRKKKTWKASIDFIPRGAKPEVRMLNDILLWILKFPAAATLILVSDKVRCSALVTKRLRGLLGWRFDVYLVEPPTDGCVDGLEWPGSLFDHPNNPIKLTLEKVERAKSIPAVGEGSSEDHQG